MFTKRFNSLIILVLFVTISVLGKDPKPTKSISKDSFYTDLPMSEVFKKAEKEVRPIFVFVNDPSCGECIQIDSMLRKSSMKDYLVEKKFIVVNFKVNKMKNMLKAGNWGVTGIPSYLFFNHKGDILYKGEGKIQKDQLAEKLSTAIQKVTDQNNRYAP